MEKIDGLTGLTNKIAARLATKPQIFIIHPAELRILRSMSDQELRAFAAENGWRVVRRLGGRQIEFYNDAGTRAGMYRCLTDRETGCRECGFGVSAGLIL